MGMDGGAATASDDKRNIKSFAVLDLETSNLPAFAFNKCGITELSIYGFTASEFRERQLQQNNGDGPPVPSALPRVLHKLTLMLNPQRAVLPEAEKITGLNNFMLEHESSFNVNAATNLISFLQHLQQPVCLVAHNGNNFDFPVVKSALQKIKMTLPLEVLCVDSLNAFRDIDEQRKYESRLKKINRENPIVNAITTVEQSTTEATIIIVDDNETELTIELIDNEKLDRKATNETTPRRPTEKLIAPNLEHRRVKRRLSYRDESPCDENSKVDVNADAEIACKSRRMLFPSEQDETPPAPHDNEIPWKHRIWKRSFVRHPRGTYTLVNTYKRIFGHLPKEAHRAEYDVLSLTQLLLNYGNDFRSYAEQYAIPFDEVKALGER